MRVLFLGDSLTEGVDGVSYLRRLEDKIAADSRLRGLELINRGCGGDTVQNLARRVRRDVVPAEPDLIIVLIGVNDCTMWLAAKSFPLPATVRTRRYFRLEKQLPRAIAPERFRDGLRVLIHALRAHTAARIVLATPPTLGEHPQSRQRTALSRYAREVRQVAFELDCDVIDLFATFTRELRKHSSGQRTSFVEKLRARAAGGHDPDTLARLRGYTFTYDGVHLTTRGADLISDVIYDLLAATMSQGGDGQAVSSDASTA